MSCGRLLHWYDMIPVISWIVLGGRCRACRGRISLQYPLVEATTAILFGFIGATLTFSIFHKIFFCAIAALLIAIAVYDMRHTIIPDPWVWSFNALTFISLFVFPLPATSYQLQAILAGPIAALPLFALWLISRGRWMGLGDAKLALGMGWLLGPSLGLFAVFSAFIIGALISLPLVLLSSEWWKRLTAALTPYHLLHRALNVKSGKGYTMKSEIPFGPFLIAACLIVWFATMYNIQIPLFSSIV